MKTVQSSSQGMKMFSVIIAAAILAVAVIFTCLSPTSNLVENVTARISTDYCNEQNAQMTSHVESFLDNKFTELHLVRLSLDVIPDLDETTVHTFLSRIEAEKPNTYYAVVDENGFVYTSDRKFLGTLSLNFLGELLNGQQRVVSNNETFNNHSCIFTGLHFENGVSMGDTTLIAAICGIQNESISDNIVLTSDYSGGFSNIISKDGSFIVKNKSDSHAGNNAFSILRSEEGVSEEELSTVIRAIQNGEPSFLRISGDIGGNSDFLYYAPIANTDWYVANTLPEEFIYSSVGNLRTQLTRLATIVIAAIAVIAVLIVLGMAFATRALKKSRDELAQEHERLEAQNGELEVKEKALKEALNMAQSANRAKTTFLNNMSHDIRTPMNAIIGYTGLASSHINNKDQVRDYLGKISQSSAHLLSLINDVLDMSRIESGKVSIEEKEEDLGEILHTLRNIVQADISNKQLDFFMDSDVADQFIVCDKLRLNQVLLNILSNSIKYTQPRGTVSVRVRQNGLTESGYGKYEFRIKDNGMGMSEEFLKTIFEPFTRVKSSTVSGIQGTGLGMAITKNIIDMMGGTIDIQSKEGEGTETVLNFAFKLGEATAEPVRIAELEGLKSLVVDDDVSACQSIAKMLRDTGMRSEWCTSGKEAIIRTEEAVSLGDTFRVYIIDWIMPDMNGIETTRRIRQAVGDEAPVIVLTAYDWSDIEQEAREAGVTAFVSKPIFPSDLHSVLNRYCDLSSANAAANEKVYNFTGKKILLVEDNEMNREIATEILEEDGFIIDTAEDGTVAVEKMQSAAPGQYDLILMDVQMPVMNGYEATRAIRALPDPEKANITILAMTANAFEEDRQEALKAGMNEHLAKPIEIDKLKATLAGFLK